MVGVGRGLELPGLFSLIPSHGTTTLHSLKMLGHIEIVWNNSREKARGQKRQDILECENELRTTSDHQPTLGH